jgi:hypothetical protein
MSVQPASETDRVDVHVGTEMTGDNAAAEGPTKDDDVFFLIDL